MNITTGAVFVCIVHSYSIKPSKNFIVMKFPILATLLATAIAVPVPPNASSASLSTDTQRQALAAALPLFQKLLETDPSLNERLAKLYPQLSDSTHSGIDLAKLQDPVADLLTAGFQMLMGLPQMIYDGVSGIMSMEYSLISQIFETLWSFVPKFW